MRKYKRVALQLRAVNGLFARASKEPSSENVGLLSEGLKALQDALLEIHS